MAKILSSGSQNLSCYRVTCVLPITSIRLLHQNASIGYNMILRIQNMLTGLGSVQVSLDSRESHSPSAAAAATMAGRKCVRCVFFFGGG